MRGAAQVAVVVSASEERQRAALEQTFSEWRIVHDLLPDRWTALRRRPLTDREVKAGIRCMIIRSSPERLVTALVRQVQIALSLNTGHSPGA
ncbi:hypothetical protein ABT352_03935 [Streptosporangium sp. NPDC000563]|uniref:hypothetical protein n=1 Tax=unclassified Streptosporangium TaxID=2632669 RepID=UPI00332A5BF9